MKRKLLFWLTMALSLMMRAQTKSTVTYSDCLDKSMYDTVYYHSLSKDKIIIDGYLNSWGADRQTAVLISKVGSDVYITMIMEKSGGSDICHRRFKIVVDECTGNEYRLHYQGKKGADSLVTLTRYVPSPSANNWCDTSSGFINYTTFDNKIPLHFYTSQNGTSEITQKVLTVDTFLITGTRPYIHQKHTIPSKLTTIAKDTARVWVEEQDKQYRLGRNMLYSGGVDSSKKISFMKIVVFDTIRLKGVSSNKVSDVLADSVTIGGEHIPNLGKRIAGCKNWIEIEVGLYGLKSILDLGSWYDVELAGSRNGTTYWIACSEYGYKSDTTTGYGNARALGVFPAYAPEIIYTVKEIGVRYPLLSVKNCNCQMPKDVTISSARFNNQACGGMSLLLTTNKQESTQFDFSWRNRISRSLACVGCLPQIDYEEIRPAATSDYDTITIKSSNQFEYYSDRYLFVTAHNCPDVLYGKVIPVNMPTSADALPAPPKVRDTTLLRGTNAKITATGTSLRWYYDLKSVYSVRKDTFAINTATVGTQTLYVTQTNGTCESEPAVVKVKVVAPDDTLIRTSGSGYELEISKNGGVCLGGNDKLSYTYGDNSLTIQGYLRTNSCAIPQTDVTISKAGNLSTVHIAQKDTAKDVCKCFGLRWVKLTLNGSFDTTRIIKDVFYSSAIDTTISRVKPLVAPRVSDVFVELGKTIRLEANDSLQNKATVYWYADVAQTSLLATGNHFNSVASQLGQQWVYCNRKLANEVSAVTSVRVVVFAKSNDSIVISPSNVGTYNGFSYDLQHDTLLVEGFIASCSNTMPRLFVRQQDTALSIDQYHGQCSADQTTHYFRFMIRVPNCNKDVYHVHLTSTDGVLQDKGTNTVLTIIRTGSLLGLDARGLRNVDTAISIPLASEFEYAIVQESFVTKLRETNAGIVAQQSVSVYKNNPWPVDGIHIHQYKAVKPGIDTIVYQSTGDKTTFRLIVHVRDTVNSISGIATSNDVAFGQGTLQFYEQIGNRYVCMAQCHTTNTGAFSVSKLNKATYLLLLIPDATATSYLPSYYINTSRWDDAFQINLVGRLENMHLPVLSYQPLNTGTAAITGTVRFDADLLLMSRTKSAINQLFPVFVVQNGRVVACTSTNETGNYQISNLPQGTYQVYVEVPGCARSIQTVNLETTASVNFTVSGNTISAQAETLGSSAIQCYPNPTQHTLRVVGVADVESLLVTSAAGVALLRSSESEIDVSSLSSGMYFVFVRTQSHIVQLSFVKQ